MTDEPAGSAATVKPTEIFREERFARRLHTLFEREVAAVQAELVTVKAVLAQVTHDRNLLRNTNAALRGELFTMRRRLLALEANMIEKPKPEPKPEPEPQPQEPT